MTAIRRALNLRTTTTAAIATTGAAAIALTLVPQAHADEQAKPAQPATAAAAVAAQADHLAAKAKSAAKTKPSGETKAMSVADIQKNGVKKYGNQLDGWIRTSLDIMHAKGIPGSYKGLHSNIMRESSGNPRAINNWDVNARAGVPSKGLLQIIKPTFERFHVAGTKNDQYDPVANIVASANYAAHRYGTIDLVHSAY
ncbi:transglycosylase SLT domain-containing protein [Streptomyces flavovirens]|uniref:transglycosylase SLT domain-containing protein n=1 Tax=Streptomyces TaxID=1883 RepID=UPI000DADF517|nr:MULTISPECIES: transglycosylase SLT domain-containing protein [unclassified Streptomyces]MYU37346.1 transglycosylase SLT domain-containing protein [Streptomyces sp. SID8358]MYX74515.1 transglycosylase SLT domain-containing protein [Streptomyces sp. SID3915]